MVEHAELIDTLLLHEPKGIKESAAGNVYVSTVVNPATGPWTGEWRKLKPEELDFTVQETATPTYQTQDAPVTVTSGIVATTTGALSQVTTFSDASKNDQELFLAVSNLLTRLSKLEDTVSKLKTLTSGLDSGLKTIGLFDEAE